MQNSRCTLKCFSWRTEDAKKGTQKWLKLESETKAMVYPFNCIEALNVSSFPVVILLMPIVLPLKYWLSFQTKSTVLREWKQ